MGMFVNYFFAGFILGKVPFQLSPSFRPMLQRGIDLPSLDVTYFTSLSYYILLLFGFQGVFRIVFRRASSLVTDLGYPQFRRTSCCALHPDIQKTNSGCVLIHT